MLRKIIQECIQQHSFSFHFLFYQAYADNEASTRLLQIVMFLLYCPPLLSCSFLSSSFTLSIYFFGCLPLLLVPSTCPYSATAGSLLFSILVTCQNHVSLLFLILSMNVISCPRSFLVSSLRILSLLNLPSRHIIRSQSISVTSISSIICLVKL